MSACCCQSKLRAVHDLVLILLSRLAVVSTLSSWNIDSRTGQMGKGRTVMATQTRQSSRIPARRSPTALIKDMSHRAKPLGGLGAFDWVTAWILNARARCQWGKARCSIRKPSSKIGSITDHHLRDCPTTDAQHMQAPARAIPCFIKAPNAVWSGFSPHFFFSLIDENLSVEKPRFSGRNLSTIDRRSAFG